MSKTKQIPTEGEANALLKVAEAKAKLYEIKEKQQKAKAEEEKLNLEKLDTLRSLASMLTYDTDDPKIGEQKLKPIMDDSEMQTIKDKMFEIIPKL